MTDIAELGLRFVPVGNDASDRALDSVTEKSKAAEKATDALASSQAKARTATGQAMAEISRSVQAIEQMIRVQGGLAATTEATARATATATNAMSGLTAAQGEVAAASKAAGAQAQATADTQIAAAKRAADVQITEAKRVAAFQAAVARGDLVATTNPLNGVTSYAPPLPVKQVAQTTREVQALTTAQRALAVETQAVGVTFADFFVEHDFAREYQQTTAATFGLSNANKGLAGIFGETAGAALGMFTALAGVAVVQFAFQSLTEAIQASATTMKNAESLARGYASVMDQAADAIDGVTRANYRLADSNKEAARTALAKQIADQQAEISRLEHPTIKTQVGRVLAGPGGAIAGRADQAQADALRASNAALLAESIKLTLSDNRAQQEANRIIDEALPKQAQLNKIHEQKVLLQRQIAMHQGDAVKTQEAINALDQRAAEIAAGSAKAHRERAAALTEEQRAFNSILQGALNYADALAKQTGELGLNAEERIRYLAGLELDKLATIDQTKAVMAVTAAIIANRDALLQKMGVEELIKARDARGKALAASPDVTSATISADDAQRASDRLNTYADLVDDVANRTRDAASGMSDAFGSVGAAIGNLAAVMADYDAKQADIAARRASEAAAYKKLVAEGKATETDRAREASSAASAERQSEAARIKNYGDEIGAFKGLFSEKSRAYKALTIAEQAFRVLEFANSVKAIILKGAEHTADIAGSTAAAGAAVGAETVKTATSLAGAAIRIPVKIAEGAASIFAALGPFGFPVVAAMLAVMAGLGFSKGGSSTSSVPTSEQRQKTQGTGSVLGDATAKSESIAKSLEIVAANTNKDFEYYNPMLKALRSIDSNIGSLTSALARQLGVGGAFDTSNLNLGTSVQGPGLLTKILAPISILLPGLFGSKTTTTLKDQGIEFNPGALGDLASQGLSGSTYQDVQSNTKKKFLGITYSNKTKNSTVTDPLDQDILGEVQRVIASLRDGVLAAATTLGVEGAQGVIDAFQVNLGKISFKDMTGQEIQDTLNAVFGKLGDDLAAAVLPDIAKFQKAGEGAFETLARVARGYQVVDVSLQSIGKTFGEVGVASIAARQHLIDLFGSIDDFQSATQFFADNFLSDVERMAPIQASVAKELARLGAANVTTKDQFKQLVLGLDLTTAAGQEMYASLLSLAPAFAKVADYVTEGSKDIAAARDELTKAYENEASALQDTIDKFDSFATSLAKFRDQLDTGPSALLSPEAQYNATKAAFDSVSAKAQLGDPQALSDLQSTSQAYLDASKAYYASSGKYFDDLARVKAAVTASQALAQRTVDNATTQLQALKDLVSPLIDINKSVISVADAIAKLTDLIAKDDAAKLAAQQAAQQVIAAQATAQTVANENLKPVVDSAAYGPATTAATPATGATGGTGYLTQDQIDAIAAMVNQTGFAGGFGDFNGLIQPFATGGSFMVGGSGGTDSQNFGPFNATPGEMVNITRPGQANDNAEVVDELRALRGEVSKLRTENADLMARHAEATVGAQDRNGKRIERAVGDATTLTKLTGGGRV